MGYVRHRVVLVLCQSSAFYSRPRGAQRHRIDLHRSRNQLLRVVEQIGQHPAALRDRLIVVVVFNGPGNHLFAPFIIRSQFVQASAAFDGHGSRGADRFTAIPSKRRSIREAAQRIADNSRRIGNPVSACDYRVLKIYLQRSVRYFGGILAAVEQCPHCDRAIQLNRQLIDRKCNGAVQGQAFRNRVCNHSTRYRLQLLVDIDGPVNVIRIEPAGDAFLLDR
ncbi:hypothetical protein D3C73_1017670 [compost metagenome]